MKNSSNFNVQVAGIRALLKSSEYFRLNSYKMSAINAYLYLNREMWNPKTGFYTLSGNRPVTRFEVTKALSVLKPLTDEPLLDAASRNQLKTLLHSWSSAL